jgi:hypothetical protein
LLAARTDIIRVAASISRAPRRVVGVWRIADQSDRAIPPAMVLPDRALVIG